MIIPNRCVNVNSAFHTIVLVYFVAFFIIFVSGSVSIWNKREPGIEPWGTPYAIFVQSDLWLHIDTKEISVFEVGFKPVFHPVFQSVEQYVVVELLCIQSSTEIQWDRNVAFVNV